MNDKTLGEIAYDAYGKTTDYKNFMGNPMPTWGDLPPKIKEAWENAALKVAEITKAEKGIVTRVKRFIKNLKMMVSGCSWVGKLNVWIFQWFFFRLAFCVEKNRKCKFVVLFPVVPLTGWWNSYKPDLKFNFRLYRERL